ncbi:transcriptional regulator, CarD family [Thermodesulfatator indicus DSM 15286]|uniref:Transcriptional regulator, CarD family n=1 Tax=Thermodesulfatator indicus (strain DSM 15286 / JCM 11887 / CIR29812) TaxID=667014 RepID=F8AC07_THEID|nr:CarD family transcriptional regulator [Thermodesulfatator indicus]AEH45706.1 transcriptional regulator, CarD family [Thermodesulfatator indicus DSM 15286]
MFSVGDMAVYPAHGVGVIEAEEKKVIGGKEKIFYVMRILDNDMTVLIPKDNIDRIGLRNIISKEETSKVYSILQERDVSLNNQTWNRRYREYMEKIKSGSIFELAQVLRDLYLISNDKQLSFGERRMLETAKSLLIKELSLAEGKTEAEIEDKINGLLSDNGG